MLYSQNDKKYFYLLFWLYSGWIILCLTTLTQNINPSVVIAMCHTQQNIFRIYSLQVIMKVIMQQEALTNP